MGSFDFAWETNLEVFESLWLDILEPCDTSFEASIGVALTLFEEAEMEVTLGKGEGKRRILALHFSLLSLLPLDK